ncbi:MULTISPECIES: hypothetical protein [unclassified Stygiolobus]|uniref:hypothetical protein n=1 Tax=unclassified Stygiolobus TaxID=2824672 RepID=UPI00307D204F
MEKEDKILVLRGIMGVVSGALSFILLNNEVIALLIPLITYALSVGIVYGIIRGFNLTKWDLLGRGVSILLASWLLIFVILYNV